MFDRNLPDITNLRVEELNYEDPLIFSSVNTEFSLHIVMDLCYADIQNIPITIKKTQVSVPAAVIILTIGGATGAKLN